MWKESERCRGTGTRLVLPAVLVAVAMAAPGVFAQEHSCGVTRNVVFCSGDDFELRMDIAYPIDAGDRCPAILFAFGGGWGYFASQSRAQFYPQIVEAAEKGYVAATVDYRVTTEKLNGVPRHCFPDPVHDLKQAVRWLRANAAKYRIDPDHIGAVGYSSGAHLVLMLGLTDENDGLEGGLGDPAISSRIQALVTMGGPGDMADLYRETTSAPQRVSDLLGGSPEEVPGRYASASPVNYVSADDPPVMLIHGDADTKIPTAQALLLDETMTRIGAPHVLVIKKDAGHVKFPLDDRIWDFFATHLR